MRNRAYRILGAVLGGCVIGGCGEAQIPPSPGGAEARNQVEYPLGPPPASKNAKAKKAAPAKEADQSRPAPVH